MLPERPIFCSMNSLRTSALLLSATVSVALGSAALSAAESTGPVVRDVRLLGALGQSAGTYTTELKFDSGASDGKVETDVSLHNRATLLVLASLGSIDGIGAPLIGFSVTQHQIETDTSRSLFFGQPSSQGVGTATLFGLHVGWGTKLLGRLHAEATAHVAYGGFTGEESITTTDGTTFTTARWHSSTNGYMSEVGLTGTLVYTFATNIQLFAAGSYLKGTGKNSIREKREGTTVYTLSNARVDAEYEMNNVIISAGLGFRLQTRAWMIAESLHY